MFSKSNFENDEFVGCTCFKPLSKGVKIEDNDKAVVMTFDKTWDEDAVLALMSIYNGK